MPNALLDADALTEAADELLTLARELNPGAAPEEVEELAMAGLGAISPRSPDAWLAMALERAAGRRH